MRIMGIHAMDRAGVGGALRGQEMGYALAKLGHEILQIGRGRAAVEQVRSKRPPDGIILTGTWHQLMAGVSNATLIAEECELLGIPCIWWYGSNGSIFGCIDPDPVKRASSQQQVIDLICQRHFIGVICPYSMGIYERHGVPRDKMRLVPSVFDGDLFSPATSAHDHHVSHRLRYKFGIPEKAFCIGTIGNTPNSKGGDDVIEAVALLARKMPDLHYLILHTPENNLSTRRATSPDGLREGHSEREVLEMSKQLARDRGVGGRVHFLGTRFMRVGMPSFYRLLDVYCSPSKAENLGQPLVESQLCGLPLVTFKGFSFDYVACPHTAQQFEASGTVTDDYGLVIPMAEPVDVADAIQAARDVAESRGTAETTRRWTYTKFHHDNATVMLDAIAEYRALLEHSGQIAVGDQGEDMRAGYAAALDRIDAEMPAPAGAVLDVGCNTGAGMEVMAERWPKAKICGVEPVSKFVVQARARGFITKIAPAEQLPYLDKHFVLVFSRHSLEHTADRAAAVAEMVRVLKPGGHVYIQAPIEPGGSKNEKHLSAFESAEEIRGLFPDLEEVYWGPQETVAELIARKPIQGAVVRDQGPATAEATADDPFVVPGLARAPKRD